MLRGYSFRGTWVCGATETPSWAWLLQRQRGRGQWLVPFSLCSRLSAGATYCLPLFIPFWESWVNVLGLQLFCTGLYLSHSSHLLLAQTPDRPWGLPVLVTALAFADPPELWLFLKHWHFSSYSWTALSMFSDFGLEFSWWVL